MINVQVVWVECVHMSLVVHVQTCIRIYAELGV